MDVRVIVEAVISAGVASCIAGSSRPCSGAEHLFSHAIDHLEFGIGLHGEKCGIGSIMIAKLQGQNWKKIVKTLKKFPNFNSSIEDINEGKMTLKKYYHIGVAVDTPHGLMVPKLRNVNNNNIDHISEELKIVSDKCRNMKIDKKEIFGGSMTVTSLGGIGGLFFTPFINYPEVAILGVGWSSKKNIYLENKYQTRTMLPLSLSYDHRIIDGAEAARFCNELKENLGKNFAYKLAV